MWNRCGPCQVMVPILNEVGVALKDKIRVVSILPLSLNNCEIKSSSLWIGLFGYFCSLLLSITSAKNASTHLTCMSSWAPEHSSYFLHFGSPGILN